MWCATAMISPLLQAMGIYSGMVQRGGAGPGGDHPDDGKRKEEEEEEEGKEEAVDFEKKMEEIIKQVGCRSTCHVVRAVM